ncbi:MAG: glycosyltransferase [Alphaproteobacteria bacterium]|nr:glycosyltransferase [Alphaproteobacteria bacterium]
MKILYSHRTKSADGQYVHIRALTEALLTRGHQVFMAGPDEFGAPSARPLDAAAGAGAMRALMPRPFAEIAELSYSLRGEARLAAAARRFAPDILYERYNLFYYAGARVARARKLPFLLEVNAPLAAERAAHGGLAFRNLARRSENAIWRSADKVLPVTNVLARMIEAAGVPAERIEVVRNGVGQAFLTDQDPRAVRARYGLEGKIVLGFTGFIRSWHGLEKAVRYLKARPGDTRLLIVGDGEEARVAIERLAASLGVLERVVITGTIEREAVPSHVAAFDIALQPAAVPYASPLKLFEYMALGRAILAPDQENIREVLTSGADALLFAPDDDAGFFAALDALIADDALRARLGAAARARLVSGELTWAGNAARLERLAQEATTARRRR